VLICCVLISTEIELLEQRPVTIACYYLWSVFISWFCGHPQYYFIQVYFSCSQWPRGLKRGSASSRLLGLWVRIPLGGMDVFLLLMLGVFTCTLSFRPQKFYGLWCVMCDLETSRMKRPWTALGLRATGKKKYDLHIYYNMYHIRSVCEPRVLIKDLRRICLKKM